MCLELAAVACILTSCFRCFLVFKPVSSIQRMPFLDLAVFLGTGSLIMAAMLFQDTWFGHMMVLLPAICFSEAFKLLFCLPTMLYLTTTDRTKPRTFVPYAFYYIVRTVGLGVATIGLLAQVVWSIYAINREDFYNDFRWGLCHRCYKETECQQEYQAYVTAELSKSTAEVRITEADLLTWNQYFHKELTQTSC